MSTRGFNTRGFKLLQQPRFDGDGNRVGVYQLSRNEDRIFYYLFSMGL